MFPHFVQNPAVQKLLGQKRSFEFDSVALLAVLFTSPCCFVYSCFHEVPWQIILVASKKQQVSWIQECSVFFRFARHVRYFAILLRFCSGPRPDTDDCFNISVWRWRSTVDIYIYINIQYHVTYETCAFLLHVLFCVTLVVGHGIWLSEKL